MSATRGISRCLIRKLPTHATKNSWSSSQQLQKRHYAVGSYKAGSKPPTHGQPTNKSHPHLLRAGEVTPGISLSEYQDRRTRLMASLPNDDSVVICTAGEIKYASGEIFYKFRQDSDFWYLTGFQEPDSALILEKTPSTSQGYRATLFLRAKDPQQELWNGPRTGIDEAATIFGVDQALDISSFLTYLKSALSRQSTIYAMDPTNAAVFGSVENSLRKRSWSSFLSKSSKYTDTRPETYETIIAKACKTFGTMVHSLAPMVFNLRSVKSKAEQHLMKSAAELSGTAHAKTMRFTEPGRSESELQAHFEYLTALGGAQRPAYVPVVASGANALVIHYTSNDQIIQDGELVLMDAGCEMNGYASDITRTWPSSGRFTEPQKDLYQAVLNTLKTCTSLCTETSNLTLYDIHRKSCDTLLSELKQIGFDRGLRPRQLEKLYPHFVSHPIGIDLHESSYQRSRSLTSGMVVTIEPGVYVPPDPAFPKHFHNIGIRLEDDILVQKDNFVRLTANAPLEISDVEGTCQGLLGIGPY